MKGIKPLKEHSVIKGIDSLLEAINITTIAEVERKKIPDPDYCIYYNSEGTIYEASTYVDDSRDYVNVPLTWIDKNHITDWVVRNGKLMPIPRDTYNRLKKYTKVTHVTELDPDLPVYVTDTDHRFIKKIIGADEVKFNKDENYYQLQQENK